MNVKHYHVTVAFRHGYGASFPTAESALEYAEAEMEQLLAEYEEFEREDFAGIYCELEGHMAIWRLERDQRGSFWVPVDDAKALSSLLGPTRQGGWLNVFADLRRRRR
jgi:hypothetical protein